MKKIIPIVLIALILAAAAAYGDSKDYYMWNAINKYLKRERCLWMIDGYLGAAETLKMLRTSPPRAKTAEEYLLEQIPDLRIEDYAKGGIPLTQVMHKLRIFLRFIYLGQRSGLS